MMATINLRNLYPSYHRDLCIEVSDDLAQQFKQWERSEQAYWRKRVRNRAYYSLDCEAGETSGITFMASSPDVLYERRLNREQLYQALAQLPEKQSRRIFAHYFMDISQAEIARAEGVSPMAVCGSIERGLRRLYQILQEI